MNYCGPGGSGSPTNATDASCGVHDHCFENTGANWTNNVFGTGVLQCRPEHRHVMPNSAVLCLGSISTATRRHLMRLIVQ